jgi:hypothetical protein
VGAANFECCLSSTRSEGAFVMGAGDKAGNWDRWYKQNIPVAEDRYAEHLRRLKEENDG